MDSSITQASTRDCDMLLENKRLETFKDWPFLEDCACTPPKLADAGFFCVGTDQEPDLVQCYVCGKQLGDWDPEDIPWEEHKSHAPTCAMIQLGKKASEMTVMDFYNMAAASFETRVSSIFAKSNKVFEDKYKELLKKQQARFGQQKKKGLGKK